MATKFPVFVKPKENKVGEREGGGGGGVKARSVKVAVFESQIFYVYFPPNFELCDT